MQLGEDCKAKPLSGNVNCFTLVEPTIRQSYGRSISRAESSGQVEAPDVASAKAAAVVQFELDEIQRNRIMVQELA